MSKVQSLLNKFKKKKKAQTLEEVSLPMGDIEAEEFNDEEILEAPSDEITRAAFSLKELKEESFEEAQEEEHDSPSRPHSDITTSKFFSLKENLKNIQSKLLHSFSNIKRKKEVKDLENSSSSKDSPASIKLNGKNLNWEKIPTFFFNTKYRQNTHRCFQLSLIFFIVFASAKLFVSILGVSKNYKSLKNQSKITIDDSARFKNSELEELIAANIFRTEQLVSVKHTKQRPVITDNICEVAVRKSRSKIKLVNTLVLQDSVKSIASVQMRSSTDLKSVREGDTLLGTIKIDRINSLQLIVKNLSTGECESIENEKALKNKKRKPISVFSMEKSKEYKKALKKIKGIENDGNNFTIERKFLEAKLGDIDTLLTQAQGIPIKNPDGTLSFKIIDIEPGGIFAYLGMQEGDIITKINGDPIKEVVDVLNLFSRVSSLSELNLTIKRNGEESKQNYSIK